MLKLAELKVRCGIEKADHNDDELLEVLERDAVAHFEAATNRYFGPVTTLTETLSVGRRCGVVLRLRAPVVTLTGVEARGGGFTGSTWESPWVVGDFEYSDNVLSLVTGSPFSAGRYNLRVTYTGGYTAGTEPRDVRAAVGTIVAETMRDGRRSPTPVEAPQPGSVALVVPGTVQETIARWYRSPGL